MDDASRMPPDTEERLLSALEAWIEARDGGRSADPAALSCGDPEIERRLRGLMQHDVLAQAVLAPEGGESPADPAAAGTDAGIEAAPERLGEFEILALLGSGGSGSVHLARQSSLGRLVALKILDGGPGADEASRVRFQREAEIAATLDHPNIVPIHAVGEAGGRRYLAMKWLSGPALDDVPLPLPPREVARIGAAIARALEAAHRSGVVHRDVKPGNIILDGERPCLIDFGLARSRVHPSVTRSSVVPGTILYLAPEQLAGEAGIPDPSADIYGLGATLYELLSDRPPFLADDVETLIPRILSEDPPPLRLRGRNRDLETVVRRALAKQRAHRFPTAAAFAEDLERWLRGDPVRSRRTGIFGRLWQRSRRHPKTSAAMAVVLLAAIAMGASAAARHARDAAVFRERLAAARDAATRWDFDVAGAVLRELERGEARDPEVAKLRELTTALLALEALLDDVQEFDVWSDERRHAELIASLERAGASGSDRRLAGLAAVAAALFRGEGAAALRELDRLEAGAGPTRGSRALRAAAAGQGPLDLDALPAASLADEHVFAAMAAHLSGNPPDDELAEIGRALECGPSSPRAQLALVVAKIRSGRLDEALSALRCSVRGPKPRRVQARLAARIQLALGDFEAAARELDAIVEPEPLSAVVRFNLLLRRGLEDDAEALLAAAPQEWQRSPSFRMAQAQWAVQRGRGDEARRHFEAAAELAPRADSGQLARASLLALEVFERLGSDAMAAPRLDREGRDEVRALEAEARGLAASLRSAEARSLALQLQAWCGRALDPADAGIALLEGALRDDPENAGAALDLASLALRSVLGRLSDPVAAFGGDPPALAEAERSEAKRGLDGARRVIAQERSGRQLASGAQVQAALRAAAVLAWRLGDAAACAAAARRAASGPADPAWSAALQALARWAEVRRATDAAPR